MLDEQIKDKNGINYSKFKNKLCLIYLESLITGNNALSNYWESFWSTTEIMNTLSFYFFKTDTCTVIFIKSLQ